MTAPSVSAVLVAWNSGAVLASCVESLRASATVSGAHLQLVVVDNASADEAVSSLELGPQDLLLRNPTNAGYGFAAAQGLARADADWVLLVNPDLVVDPGFFEALERVLETAPADVGALVPELRFASATSIVNSRGLTVDEDGIPAEVDLGERVVERLPVREVFGGSSGCCLLRRDAVYAVGGPEPVYFAYLEDVDLALRLQRGGYRALFVPDAIAWHEGSQSTGEGSPVKSFLVARNRRILFRLHGPHTLRAQLSRAIVDLGHGLASSAFGDTVAPWRGRADALRLRSYVDFLRRSRRRYDARVADPPRTRRAGLRAAWQRKRSAARMMEH